MDGNDSNDPIFVEDFPTARKIRRSADEVDDAELLRDDGQSNRGRARLHLGRRLHRAPIVVVSENIARENWKDPAAAIGRRIRPDTQAPMADHRRRRRRRARQRRRPAGAVDHLLAADDRSTSTTNKLFAQRNVASSVRTDRAGSPTLLTEIQQRGLVGQRKSAGRERADARSDPSRVDGADVVRAGDAGDRGRRRAPARGRRHLRRDRLHRDAADQGDRHPHRTRRRDRATSAACSSGRAPCSPASASAAGSSPRQS